MGMNLTANDAKRRERTERRKRNLKRNTESDRNHRDQNGVSRARARTERSKHIRGRNQRPKRNRNLGQSQRRKRWRRITFRVRAVWCWNGSTNISVRSSKRKR